jgi:hypothetical protein
MSLNQAKAADYLIDINWKNFVEWLTAEVVLNRPNDPLQFTRDLIGVKILERGANSYMPEKNTDWLRNCYAEAMALVDDRGIIRGKQVEEAQESQNEKFLEMKRKVESMKKLLEQSVQQFDVQYNEIVQSTITMTAEILNCETVSIYRIENANMKVSDTFYIYIP